MPYGSLMSTTREYIETRAKQSNIEIEKLGLEEFGHTAPCLAQHSFSDCICSGDDETYEISVIYGGALDEEFYVKTLYVVNIADWIAEMCRDQPGSSPDDWEVIVTRPEHEDSGILVYRTSSWDQH